MTNLLLPPHAGKRPITLRLKRNLTRAVKRGDPWIFADSLRDLPPAKPGRLAVLHDNQRGRPIAIGYYTPNSPLALRLCSPNPNQPLNDNWAAGVMERAVKLRQQIFTANTSGYRLFNGEGDGLPGLVVDCYNDTAVMRLDGDGAAGFWHAPGIGAWLAAQGIATKVILRTDRRTAATSERLQQLCGPPINDSIDFLEHGHHFKADVGQGQKTGFFLDQRENRQRIKQLSNGRRVLNLFGYTGGFSVYAGTGGAAHVTTVDVAKPAIAAANDHWAINGLEPKGHQGIAANAFEFLSDAANNASTWDVVIIDPPSFVPAHKALKKGLQAYQTLARQGADVTASGGILALASCSSHVTQTKFMETCQEGISAAKRRGTVLGIFGQPADHPSPLALPAFRYLKFILFKLD